MDKHTPGPWTIEPNGDAYVKYSGLVSVRIDQDHDAHPDSLAVALIIADCPRLTETGQARANALLISAAPELLEACRVALKVIDEAYDATGHFKMRRTSDQRLTILDAIDKAEGRRP